MSEMLITICSGVIVFALSQWLMEIWVKPLQEYKNLKRRIATVLVYNAQYWSNALSRTITDETIKKEYSTAADDTRRLAAELKGYIELVPLIHPGIPNRTNLEEASSYLIGLSNGFYQLPEGSEDKSAHYNNQRIEKIKKLLKLYNHH